MSRSNPNSTSPVKKDETGYRVRLRFRATKALGIADSQIPITIDRRNLEIRSDPRDQPLNKAKWFVISAGGFRDELEALQFGERLRSIFQIASLCSHWGIDVGNDTATSWIDEEYARELGLIEPHQRIAGNIHGLMTFPDDDRTRVPHSEITLSVQSNVEQLLSAIESLATQADLEKYAAQRGVTLLNHAIMQSEPLTRIVLAFSAVENLGQAETWSSEQTQMLKQAADAVQALTTGSPEERREVSDAIIRGTHRIGLRQGVIRVLRELGFADRIREWDNLYRLRSGVIHGTAKLDDGQLNELAGKSVKFAMEVIIRRLQHMGLNIPEVAKTHFSF